MCVCVYNFYSSLKNTFQTKASKENSKLLTNKTAEPAAESADIASEPFFDGQTQIVWIGNVELGW